MDSLIDTMKEGDCIQLMSEMLLVSKMKGRHCIGFEIVPA